MSIPEVTVDELEAALAAGGRVIDVREVHEYTDGHVPGASLVVLSTVPDHVDAFRDEPAVFVICRSGARSMQACQYLAEQGVDTVNVAGGTMAWILSGRPVVAGDQPS